MPRMNDMMNTVIMTTTVALRVSKPEGHVTFFSSTKTSLDKVEMTG